MSKRSRFLVILFVIALCFVFLWPSISWYGLTPKEDQALALGSLEKIKDYARIQASEDVLKIEEAARVDENAQLPAEFAYLEKIAKKNYKESGKKQTLVRCLKKLRKTYQEWFQLKFLHHSFQKMMMENHYT